ncbi:MAG: type IV toxin-antitoxin system AbiEi family antitoxin [Ginsengibacter sp.]
MLASGAFFPTINYQLGIFCNKNLDLWIFLTNYLRPGELTLYITENRNELIKKYRLVPDIKGNIKIYKVFWHQKEETAINTVHPLLVYADLINTGDRRCIETAQKIYDELLANKF